MKIYLIRHAETEWNVSKRLQGWGDGPLTEKGKLQSAMLGKRLESIKFNSIYCSTSGRARTTLSIALKEANAEYFDSLREISLGTWEGREQSEIEKENPVQFDNFWHHPDKFSVDGAETFFDVYKRTGDILRRLAQKEQSDFIIISHTIAIRAMIASATGNNVSGIWDGEYLKPTSITCLEYSSEIFKLIYFGDANHLE